MSIVNHRRGLPDKTRIRSFQNKILDFYAEHGRDLPFRRTTDPYRITVSEFMLQQTQVERVVPKYEAWVARWSNWKSLARALRQEVLAAWSGLGYNRRAIYLQRTAGIIATDHNGQLPDTPESLTALPGIGPYTARAILIFAFNKPLAAIDTNIRRVLLYEFGWSGDTPMGDIERLAEAAIYETDNRSWHYALMDYSRLALPKQIKSIPPLTRQSRFEGSIRQIRGEIIRQLTGKSAVRKSTIAQRLNRSEEDVESACRSLEKDGLVTATLKTIRLS